MRVLVATEPRFYREVMAAAFQGLGPNIESRTVQTPDLNEEVLLANPDLVVCDRVTPTVEATVRFWIEYGVENDALVVTATNVRGLALHTADIDLYDFLSLIDSIDELIKSDGGTTTRGDPLP